MRGDGDFKLCPAAQIYDLPPLFLCVVIYGLLIRLQHVNELSVAAVAEGFADKLRRGNTIDVRDDVVGNQRAKSMQGF